MKTELDRIIVQYCLAAKAYAGCSNFSEYELMHDLNWGVFRMAVYLGLPDEIVKSIGTAEAFLNKLDGTLLYNNVAFEEKEKDSREKIRIAGYEVSQDKESLSCFSMLCFLIYSFFVPDAEKEDFLLYMLIAPCCARIEKQFEKKTDKDMMKRAFHLSDRYGLSLELKPEEKRKRFRELYKKYRLSEHLAETVKDDMLIEMESGFGMMNSEGSRRDING